MINRVSLNMLYKISILTGFSIAIISLYISMDKLQKIQTKTFSVYEASILARLDLESLTKEHTALKNVIDRSTLTEKSNDTIRYSEHEIKKLTIDARQLEQQIIITNDRLHSFENLKNNIKNEYILYSAVIISGLTLGFIFIILGLLGWYYQIKIFQERRNKPRDGDI